MGLLEKLFRKQPINEINSRSGSSPAVYDLEPWKRIPADLEVIQVDNSIYDYLNAKNVYVYNADIVRDLRKGQKIVLTPYLGEGNIYSTVTGTKYSSKENCQTFLQYNGSVIGVARINKSDIKALAKMGIALNFQGECLGDLKGYNGVKNIVVYAPEHLYFYDFFIASLQQKGICVKEFDYNEYDEDDYAALTSKKYWEFPDAVIKILPVPKGSKAKPHILLESNSGRKISEVTGKNASYYNELRQIAESNVKVFIYARRFYLEEKDIDAYHIHISYYEN